MTPKKFSEIIAAPNVEESLNYCTDIRIVFNACAGVEALASHLFVYLRDKAATQFTRDGKFKHHLASQSEAFRIIHDIAEVQKHARLDSRSRLVKRSDDVSLQKHGLDISRFGELILDVGDAISVEIDGQIRTVAPLAQQALKFLDNEISKAG
jgi:hypothetical protein